MPVDKIHPALEVRFGRPAQSNDRRNSARGLVCRLESSLQSMRVMPQETAREC